LSQGTHAQLLDASGLTDVSPRRSTLQVLAKGLSMGVLVGGVHEQVTVQRGVQAIAIKNK
jgi:hypothetical protein